MRPRRPVNPAFTLMELLVSMSLLVLLTGMVVAMVNGVSRSTTATRRQLASDNEARKVFDRMGADFARMLKRPDADAVFASIKNANDKMFFYSDAPVYYDTTGLGTPTPTQNLAGLVGYRIPGDNSDTAYAANRWQLQRLGKGLAWDRTSATSTPGAVVFLTYPAASTTPDPLSTLAGAWPTTLGTDANHYDEGVDASYHVLSGDVFRLEFCLVLKNPTASAQYTTTLTRGQGFNNVSAIIVGLALLDAQSRTQIPVGVSMNALAAALPDPDFTVAPPNKLMAELWAGKLNALGFAAGVGVPQAVVSQIRVYQRTFYLNTP